jgi:Tfp pilus assembly protein PilE
MDAKTKWAFAIGAIVLVVLAIFAGAAYSSKRSAEKAKVIAEQTAMMEKAKAAEAARLAAEKDAARLKAEADAKEAAAKQLAAELAKAQETQKVTALAEQLAKVEAEKAAAQKESELSAFKAFFEDTSDILEVGEQLSAVKDAITSSELKTLVSGKITTAYGTTDYNQYLRFDGTTGKVVFDENRDDVVGDYLFFEADEPVFEYELEFPSGLESQVEDGVLEDLDGRKINVLGREYTFVNSRFNTATKEVTLELLSGDQIITLKEGESQKVMIAGKEHEVTLAFVSDPRSASTPEAKITVDGETTQALGEGKTDVLLGSGLEVGVSEILVNSRESIVKMFFGAHKLVLADKMVDDTYKSGAEVDRERVSYVDVKIKGNEDGDKVVISSVKYRVNADAKDGSDIYIAAGKGLREFIKDQIGLLSEKFDIRYDGLAKVGETKFSIESSGDDQYVLSFTNRKGVAYSIDYVTSKDGSFHYGTDDEMLWFVEASGPSMYNVKMDDTFVLTDQNTDKGYTAVLKYEDIDTDENIITFTDLGSKGGEVQVTYSGVEGAGAVGDLIVNGKTFKVYVGAGADPLLAIDLNSDGLVDGSLVSVVTNGGGVFKLGPSLIMGSSFVADFTTLAKNFDSATSDEVMSVTIKKVNTDELTLDVSGIDTFSVGDDEKGMTRYGAMVTIKDGSDSPDELEVMYPLSQRKAMAYVQVSP